MIEVTMPQVGQDVPTAIITEWCIGEGDVVAKGDVLAVVESDKASFDVEADGDGHVLSILAAEGAEVEVFKPIAYIGDPGETVPAGGTGEQDIAASVAPTSPAAPAAIRPASAAPADRLTVSPAARRRAGETGLDLTAVAGTGPGGRIIRRDVDNSPPAPRTTTALTPGPDDTVVPFSRLRQRIADRLTLSKQTVPHFTLFMDVDMTNAMSWRAATNADSDTRITVTDIVIHAAANALRESPELNAHVDAKQMILRQAINIGVAVAVDDGLLVPVLADADALAIADVSTSVRKLANEAQAGKLTGAGTGSFTVTSLGMCGVSRFVPIINPPECAILAVGSVEKRAVPDAEDNVIVRAMMTLTLAADHRAVDGVIAARFLNLCRALLENYPDHSPATGR